MYIITPYVLKTSLNKLMIGLPGAVWTVCCSVVSPDFSPSQYPDINKHINLELQKDNCQEKTINCKKQNIVRKISDMKTLYSSVVDLHRFYFGNKFGFGFSSLHGFGSFLILINLRSNYPVSQIPAQKGRGTLLHRGGLYFIFHPKWSKLSRYIHVGPKCSFMKKKIKKNWLTHFFGAL